MYLGGKCILLLLLLLLGATLGVSRRESKVNSVYQKDMATAESSAIVHFN
jgi:hypothetical protein